MIEPELLRKIKQSYDNAKESGVDDWEDKFFESVDAMWTDKEKVLVSLIYFGNDDIVDTVMNMVVTEKVLRWDEFSDDDTAVVIAVCER